MTTTRAYEIDLTIPDNEALTALSTLRRLGFEVGSVQRSDLWRLKVDAEHAGGLGEKLATVEAIFNPNKHALRARESVAPDPGEVWIADRPAGPAPDVALVAGRHLPGVERAERFVSWRLFNDDGHPAAWEEVDRAVETLLCNPSFQRAIR
jgi:phosphoribosylformylglycinamidine (FGAM) synthase PurS component